MAFYYYIKDGQELGPFTIDELKEKRLRKTTLFWTEGLEDWTTGESIKELDGVLVAAPPPTISTQKDIQKDFFKQFEKYDSKQKKFTDATTFGIILIVVQFTIFFLYQPQDDEYNLIYLFFFGLRILVVFVVVDIAKRLNRDSTSWGIFAFIFPTICLIIIGLIKKRKFKQNLESSMPLKQQIEIVLEEAYSLIREGRFEDAIILLNAIIKVDNKNYEPIINRAYAHYNLGQYEKAEKDFIFLKKENQYEDIVQEYLQKINEGQ